MNKRKNSERSAFWNIFIAIVTYIFFWILLNMLGALFFLTALKSVKYSECFWMIVFGRVDYNSAPLIILVVYTVISLVNMIAGVVLTSFIFLFLTNRKPKILLPNKLVIRRRTSEGSQGKLVITAIIGNQGHYLLDDVTCTIHCTYVKTDIGGGVNSEYESTTNVISIDNYYRFSFELDNLPRQFLRNFIRKDSSSMSSAAVVVVISGRTGFGAGTFKLRRKYKLSDIVIYDKEPVFKVDRKRFFFSKRYKILWDNILNNPDDCNEIARTQIIEDIKEMCKYSMYE